MVGPKKNIHLGGSISLFSVADGICLVRLVSSLLHLADTTRSALDTYDVTALLLSTAVGM